MIRATERRETWAAFFSLLLVVASHQVLETARDALFLSSLPATQLPWVYLLIAAFSLLATQLRPRRGSRLTLRAALNGTLLVASLATFGLWVVAPYLGTAGLYIVYVWSGVLVTIILLRFWILLSAVFTVTQAKRLYTVIGTGSVLGAIVGSALSRALLEWVEPNDLVAVSAGGLGLTCLVTLLLPNPERAAAEGLRQSRKASTSLVDSLQKKFEVLAQQGRMVTRHLYVRHVAILALMSACCLTLADFVFKSAVAEHVPAGELGTFFADVYLVLNILSFCSQLFLVPLFLRRFDLTSALMLLPALLLVGGVGMVLSAGIVAALAIKAPDGALRYSLHRTATELLFVPMTEKVRDQAKTFIDVAGQKGGQALASAVIVALAAVGLSDVVAPYLLAGFAVGWATLAYRLRIHYLALFRSRLEQGDASRAPEHDDLDLGSLENLLQALDSQDDERVVAALDILEREEKTVLVPRLILYHPSAKVVEHALLVFLRSKRTNIATITKHLLDHETPSVRATAIAVRSSLASDVSLLRALKDQEEHPEVLAAIAVQLFIVEQEGAVEELANLEEEHGTLALQALARSVALHHDAKFLGALEHLALHVDSNVRAAAAKAIAAFDDPALIAPLIGLLGHESTRDVARTALASFGPRGFEAVALALTTASLPRAIRWQLPRALSLFEPQSAADQLVRHLPEEDDGLVRYRMLRSIESLADQHPSLKLDTEALGRAMDATLARIYRYLDRRVALVEGAKALPSRATPGHELLENLLHDKQQHAVGRLFRLLGLVYRREDFMQIFRGLSNGDPKVRAASFELLENILRPPLREAVSVLVDDLPDEGQREAGSRYHKPRKLGYAEVLLEMLRSESDSLRDFTFFHIGELKMTSMLPPILELDGQFLSSADAKLALEILHADEELESVSEHAS